jgi:mycoredoxin
VAQPLTMYTTTWCAFCKRLKSQLAKAGIEIAEVNIEQDPAAAEYVMSVNGGFQTVPTVVFPDGSALTNPSLAAVSQRLAELAANGAPAKSNRAQPEVAQP